MAFDNIFEIMKERGLTAYRVSKDTGISQASIADWRKGRSKPKIDKLKILAEYFGVSLASAKDISKEDMQKAVEYIEFLKSKNK